MDWNKVQILSGIKFYLNQLKIPIIIWHWKVIKPLMQFMLSTGNQYMIDTAHIQKYHVKFNLHISYFSWLYFKDSQTKFTLFLTAFGIWAMNFFICLFKDRNSHAKDNRWNECNEFQSRGVNVTDRVVANKVRDDRLVSLRRIKQPVRLRHENNNSEFECGNRGSQLL